MRGLRKNRAPSRSAAQPPGREAAGIYDSHAAGLYRQALLTLEDTDLAEQVVMSVIVDECLQPGAPGTAAARLAAAVYWRCQDLAGKQGRRNRPGLQLVPAGTAIDPAPQTLTARERGTLGLVLFGGLGYTQASREMAIPPRDLAAILRTALHRLTAPPGGSASPAST